MTKGVLPAKDRISRATVRAHSFFVRTGKDKAFPLRLDAKQGSVLVPAAAGRKFKKHVDRYVLVQALVTLDAKYRQLETVRSVARALAPGARDPKKGEAAMHGRWQGAMFAKKVPAGIPGVSAGGSFAVSFVAGGARRKVTGRLRSQRGPNRRDREVQVPLVIGQ